MSRLLSKYRELLSEETSVAGDKPVKGIATESFNTFVTKHDTVGGNPQYYFKLSAKNSKQPDANVEIERTGVTFKFSSGDVEGDELVQYTRDLVNVQRWCNTLSGLMRLNKA